MRGEAMLFIFLFMSLGVGIHTLPGKWHFPGDRPAPGQAQPGKPGPLGLGRHAARQASGLLGTHSGSDLSTVLCTGPVVSLGGSKGPAEDLIKAVGFDRGADAEGLRLLIWRMRRLPCLQVDRRFQDKGRAQAGACSPPRGPRLHPSPQWRPLEPCFFCCCRLSWRKCSLFGFRPKACSLWWLNSWPPSVTVGPSSRAFLFLLRFWGAGFFGADSGAPSSCAGGLSGRGRFPCDPLGTDSGPSALALSPCGFLAASVGTSVLGGWGDSVNTGQAQGLRAAHQHPTARRGEGRGSNLAMLGLPAF